MGLSDPSLRLTNNEVLLMIRLKSAVAAAALLEPMRNVTAQTAFFRVKLCDLYHVVGLLRSSDHDCWPFKFGVVKQTHSLHFRDHASCLSLPEPKIPVAVHSLEKGKLQLQNPVNAINVHFIYDAFFFFKRLTLLCVFFFYYIPRLVSFFQENVDLRHHNTYELMNRCDQKGNPLI